ncbi:DUF4394 domain-containing protein [Xylophilus sp. Kf1]|nr:DUF4394 domain-containing protein [Xylophilus sp. Kf1]
MHATRFSLSFPLSVLAAVATASLVACGGSNDATIVDVAPTPVAIGDAIAITTSGRVVSFNRATPATLVSNLAVRGLGTNERLVGIDVRPSNNTVYAVSSLGGIFTLDATTGTLTRASSLSVALQGTAFGVDFNPMADRLRIVSNTGQNLRVDVTSGAATVDGAVNGSPATVSASAYTNSFDGTTSTQLYNLDAATGTLLLQDPPNNGTQANPVALGVTFDTANGFDIDARNNRGYAAVTVGGANRLYTVPLSGTGGATLVGAIGTADAITGLALVQPATPRAYALTDDGRLAAFSPSAPNTITASVAISGLAAGETVLGVDFRPANARLYALTSAARLLTIDPDTGVPSAAVALAADATDTTLPYAGLTGTTFSVDFNPVADRLRVISSTGQNLRINVDTGATTTDGVINRTVPPTVLAGAYTNSFAGTTATVLYDVEGNTNVLSQQNPPNDGTLVDVGPIGFALGGRASLDIAGGANGLVLAALRNGATGPFSLYTVSLTTGAATLYRNTGAASLSFIGGAGGPAVRDVAIRY